MAGEGADVVLRNARERAGVRGVALATAYHDVRDVLPHNPARRVATGGAGVCFAPEWSRYPRGFRPALSDFADGRDLLGELCVTADRQDARVDAWLVYLHDDRDDPNRPGTVRNVFGDHYPETLCPADPRVREYAVALTEDVTRYPVGAILAEALHWLPFRHGGRHERCFVRLDPLADLLLGLCFCDHCRAAATAYGVAVPDLAAAARTYLESCLAGEPTAPDADLHRFADGELAAYLDVRVEQVTALVTDVADVARQAGVPLRLLDLAAGIGGWDTGRPTGPSGVDVGRPMGVRAAALAEAVPVSVAAYAADTERVQFELAAYRRAVGPAAQLGVVLRPTAPDCLSTDNLATKLSLARSAGVDRVDFYHYGLMPLTALDRIRHTLTHQA